MNVIDALKSPPDAYRPYPFWFWNGEMSEEEITWQMEEFRRQGITTVLIHPRHGLVTPYLSDEYMALVVHTATVAQRLDMKIILYDEYNWPSGTVAGRLLHDYPEYGMQLLRYRYVEATDNYEISAPVGFQGSLLCAQGCNLETGEIHTFEVGPDNMLRMPEGRWGIGIFYLASPSIMLDSARGHSHAYPESGYLDVMNPEAVRKFIDLTHEVYKQYLGEWMGSVVQGMFTDEVGIIYDFDYNYDFAGAIISSLPWTAKLEEAFLHRKGYQLRDRLVHLIADVKGAVKTRLDYWDVVTSLYVESYHKQISEWCEREGIAYTGHVVMEELSMHYQGDLDAALKYLHAPGLDCTSKTCSPIDSPMFFTAKIASSASHRMKRDFTVCEAYGATGWSLTPNDMKRTADFSYAFGVNQLCLHGFLYTVRAGRKYECPPSEFIQSPWWKYMSIYSDYIAKLGYLLSQGNHLCHVGVLLNTRGYWSNNNRINFIDSKSDYAKDARWPEHIARILTEIGVDYDIVFDSALAACSITDEGIEWGREVINTLIIPPTQFFTADLWASIETFLAHGGKVLLVGETPYVLGSDLESVAVEPEVVRSIFRNHALADAEAVRDGLIQMFDGLRTRVVLENGEDAGCAVLKRIMPDGTVICFVYNYTDKCVEPCSVRVPGSFQVTEIDIEDVSTRQPNAVIKDCETAVKSSFRPFQSRVFMMQPSSTNMPDLVTSDSYEERSVIELGPEWEFSLDRENILRIKDFIMIPKSHISERESKVYFDIFCDDKIDDVSILFEGDICQSLRVNGKDVSDRQRSYRYFDCNQIAVHIGDHLNIGRNACEFTYITQYEDTVLSPLAAYGGIYAIQPHIFVLGRFAVGDDGHLSAQSPTINSGPWESQGFPWYSGSGIYQTHITVDEAVCFSQARLCCDVGVGCVEATINGLHCGVRVWEPYEIDISKALRVGSNDIEIKVTNTAANLLRPLATEVNLENQMAWLRGIHEVVPNSGLHWARIELFG